MTCHNGVSMCHTLQAKRAARMAVNLSGRRSHRRGWAISPVENLCNAELETDLVEEQLPHIGGGSCEGNEAH